MQSSAKVPHSSGRPRHPFFLYRHFFLSLQPTKWRSSYSKVFAACLTQLPPDARVRGQGLPTRARAFRRLPGSVRGGVWAWRGDARAKKSLPDEMQSDKANERQLQSLIMLIKRCAALPCDAAANEDLSVNEECNMITDRDKKSSDHLSLAAAAAFAPASSSSACYIPLVVVNTDGGIEIYGC